MQLRYDSSELDAQGYITLDTVRSSPATAITSASRFPFLWPATQSASTNLMIDLSDAIERSDDADRVLDKYDVTTPAEREPMAATVADMQTSTRTTATTSGPTTCAT